MPLLTDNRFILKIFSAILIIVFCFPGASFSEVTVVSSKSLTIDGPAVIKLNDLGASDTICLSAETMIHLPKSVKNVFVEKYDYPTSQFEAEIRAYTIQQAIFWTITTLALGSSVRQR